MVGYSTCGVSYVVTYRAKDLFEKLPEPGEPGQQTDEEMIENIWKLILKSNPANGQISFSDEGVPDAVFDNALHLDGEYLVPLMESYEGDKKEFLKRIKPYLLKVNNLITSSQGIDGSELGANGMVYLSTVVVDFEEKKRSMDLELLDKIGLPYKFGIHTYLAGVF